MEDLRERRKRSERFSRLSTGSGTSRMKKRGVVELDESFSKPFGAQMRCRNCGCMFSIPSPRLPDEIIFNILVRLPVKSLIRFRAVCKQWRTLISDPYFIKQHLDQSAKVTSFRSHHVIAKCGVYLRSYPLYTMYNGKPPRDFGEEEEFRRGRILGSCNGLVCVAKTSNCIVIWNPSTRKYNELPSLLYGFSVFGFGYDVSSDDYKVVAISFPEIFSSERVVQVYSLKAKRWKSIQSSDLLPTKGPGIFVDGYLYWGALDFLHSEPDSNRKFDSSWKIISFDLSSERFSKVPGPRYYVGTSYPDVMIGVLSGRLCTIIRYGRKGTDFWLMGEHGVRESWNISVSLWGRKSVVPLWISETGKILLHSGSEVCVYDSKSGMWHHSPSLQNCYEAIMNVESLVSPFAEGRP